MPSLPLPGPPLPIDAILDEVVRTLAPAGASLVIEAPPGAGKTTRLPIALLQAGLADAGELLILQPRRLAARMAAARVAELLGEAVGERVGYQVRFESQVGPRTRVRFLTEGLLTRRLQGDPTLRGVGTVILDEFHERSQDADLALALLRRLQRGARPDLRIVVMSATLDQGPVADYLGCPALRSEGRAFPVEVEYAGDDGELPSRVLRAFHGLIEAGLGGDALVFLPGAREIRACMAACAPLCERAGVLALPLHGDLSPAEQDRAVRPSATRRLILSTNVAETSVTIDGVTAVIDAGLARVAAHSPWTGIATLQVAKISRASAIQRAGRAGRTRPGRCVRLYSRFDFERRPAFTPAAITRLDLAGALLDLHAAGAGDPRAFPWFEAPPAAAIDAAEALLRRLDAVDEGGALTATGRAMLRFPAHPRLARLLVEGERRGVPSLAAGAAAILGERSLRRELRPARVDADADVLIELRDLEQFERQGAAAAERLGLSQGACRQALRARDHLLRLCEGGGDRRRRRSDAAAAADEEALRLALLSAFPDRVCQAQGDLRARTLLLAGGGSARLSDASVVRSAPWLLALAIEERRDQRGAGEARVESAAAIEPEWLLELFPAAIEAREELSFEPGRERVEGRAELRYLGLCLDASPLRRLPPAASALLRQAALAAGPARFVADPAALAELSGRTAFVAGLVPGSPVIDDARAREALAALCEGRTSFAELARADLLAHLQGLLIADDPAALAALERLAPTHARLASGRRAAIHYPLDRPPWLASRLQDFFGMERGPSVGDGRVPVVLHLLAPNGRDVQVTTDLAGFWARHYPELRRALMRRYPRHAWPEDPRVRPPDPPPRRKS